MPAFGVMAAAGLYSLIGFDLAGGCVLISSNALRIEASLPKDGSAGPRGPIRIVCVGDTLSHHGTAAILPADALYEFCS